MTLGKEDILVIEGIHCLNDALSHSLPKESKFRIYISALTQLNVDEHNRIPTTDGRLIRRLVRDARTRGTNAARDHCHVALRAPGRGGKYLPLPGAGRRDVQFRPDLRAFGCSSSTRSPFCSASTGRPRNTWRPSGF